MDNSVLVKCSRCGEFIRTAPELIGDNSIAEIEKVFMCGICEEEYEGNRMAHEALYPEDFEMHEEYEPDTSCPLCGGDGKYDLDEAGEVPCPECNGTGILF